MLSIILLTYNNLSATKRCIEELYRCTSNFDLIIVDNNSTDGTKKYLQQLFEKHSNTLIEYNIENQGIVKARNCGYRIAIDQAVHPDYIMFMDNDQIVTTGWWKTYTQLFKQGYDVIGTEAWSLRSDFYPHKKIKDKNDSFSYVGCGGLCISKKVAKTVPVIFDEQYYQFFEDPDFIFDIFYNTPFLVGWNYNPVIIHDHKGPLLTPKTKSYFMKSWEKFQNKWKDCAPPIFKME